jgi:hypothetical protein
MVYELDQSYTMIQIMPNIFLLAPGTASDETEIERNTSLICQPVL